ncbi:WD40 repeat domain-containing protein [Catellatospora aurea]|uniref:WD40 repeat domain-containing protein n=1 Tax=Catellatospora aurea TaxID=1337874 RepID=A0ABW2H5H0_9ACTN
MLIPEPDGQYAGVASVGDRVWTTHHHHGVLTVRDALSREVVRELEPAAPPHDIVAAPDGSWLAARCGDGVARIWDLPSGRLRQALEGQHHRCLTRAQDGSWIAAATGDRTVRLWDTEYGMPRAEFSVVSPVNHMTATPDGTSLVLACADGRVRVRNLRAGARSRPLEGTTVMQMWSVSASPDGSLYTGAAIARDVQLWDAATGRRLRVLWGHSDHVRDVAFSPDGRWFASSSYDATVRIWHPDAQDSAVRPLSEAPDSRLCWLPDSTGLCVIVAGRPVTVAV